MRILISLLLINLSAYAGLYSPVMTTTDRFRELFIGLLIWGSPVWAVIAIWLVIVLPIKLIIYLVNSFRFRDKPIKNAYENLLDKLEE